MPENRATPRLRPNSLLVYIMAIACGAAVANLYYAQPLLDTLAQYFDISTGTAGLVVALTQLGYVAGLALIVPLGDLLQRRRLIVTVSVGTAIALAGAAVSPGIDLFLVASLAIGLTAVVAQILVPFAAHLASDEQRGAVVGRVMSGLLIGVLLARTVSGFVADALGWRIVFGLAAAVMLGQALVLRMMLPRGRPQVTLSYPALVRSIWHLVREEPQL
ncbi:MAG TPA: MFS transporter, partial [Gammaproteobacteria bacterium]|nr:MFS transporter [Gammaproteobacteria bacterium]